MAAVLQDLQPALDGPSAAERIGDVAQPVLVEGPGDQQTDGDRDRSGNQRWRQLPHAGGDPADCGADDRARDREPRDGPVE